jgi:4-hydroxybenzoyl-CoA thioesterase
VCREHLGRKRGKKGPVAFLSQHPVRFADIDRAGIVYYPRFFDYFHRAFEDFFGAEAGVPYHKLVDELGVGFPTVHIETDFRIPLQYGDVITVELALARIGNKSMTVRYRAFRPGMTDAAAESLITTACVDMKSFKPMSIPQRLRETFQRHWVAP